MNERFFTLPPERQKIIINAAYKTFGENSYKNTSTDNIAKEAGISKALLFHYFGSKKELYVFLFQHAIDYLESHFEKSKILHGDDFFEIVRQSRDMKIRVGIEFPYLTDFIIKAYYEDGADVLDGIQKVILGSTANVTEIMMQNINKDKFRDINDIPLLTDMLTLYSEAYMRREILTGKELDINVISKRLDDMLEVLKRRFYKEEYL